LLKDFKKVLVAEDYMNFPEFEMAREFAEQGRLGAIEAIFLMNTGYRYHALAAIRSFLNFPGIVRVQAIAAANGNFFIGFRFDGGGRGYVTEPNRRFDGGWAVVGKTGILASDESCLQAGSSTLDQFVISPRWKSETDFDGFEINGTGTHQFKAVPRYNELVGLGYQNRTRLNVMRNCGLIRILESLNEDNINSRYSGYEGVYDSIASTVARRAPQLGLVGTHLALATATRLVRGRTGAGRR
jgi:hypothetical protein